MGEVRRGDESNEAEAETNYFVAVAGALTLPPISHHPVTSHPSPLQKNSMCVYTYYASLQDPEPRTHKRPRAVSHVFHVAGSSPLSSLLALRPFRPFHPAAPRFGY